MKATKNNITTLTKAALILLMIAFQSCGTYNSKTAEIENDLLNGNFDGALAGIDKNKFLLKDRNKLLYLMEKGKLEHLKGNYAGSNVLLEEAYIMIDDKIKTNVGQAIAGKFTNPMAEPYKGEDFEKVTIHYYKALNYFMQGMPAEALVEAKRINIKLLELNDRYPENKNKYREDAFSQILQGIIYESTGDINNAFIAYRNAEEIYNKDNGRFFGMPMPEQLKEDLLRTTKKLGFIQEHNDYKKKFNVAPDPAPKKETAAKGKKSKGKKVIKEEKPAEQQPKVVEPTGEAIVFWENGLAPAKDQIVITASGGSGIFYGSYMDGDTMEEILIPIPPGTNIGSINAIAIPKYRKRESYYSKASIVVDNEEQQFELAQDFYPIAKQCLKDRMLRETINLVLRFAAKKGGSALLGALAEQAFGSVAGDVTKLGADAAGAATEKADTRNWQSLPATIGYARVPLKEGENKFVLRKYGPQGIDTDTLTIPYRRGLQIVNYFDLGRTQVIPAAQTMGNLVSTLNGNSQNAATTNTLMGGTSGQVNAATPSASGYRPAPAGVTVNSVVDSYVAAMGGADKLKSVRTQYMQSRSNSMYNGQASSTDILIKVSGNKMYSATTISGQQPFIMLITEEGAWQTVNGKRSKMDKKTAEMMKKSTMLYDNCITPLSNNGKLGGITTINNEDAYAVSYNLEGSTITHYYSVKSGLVVASSAIINAGGMTMKSMNNFSDYRNINGIMFPFKMSTTTDNMGTSEMVYSVVKFNEGVTDADFQ